VIARCALGECNAEPRTVGKSETILNETNQDGQVLVNAAIGKVGTGNRRCVTSRVWEGEERMDASQPAGMYLFAMLFYALPSAFLWAAWRREIRAAYERPGWRSSSSRVPFFAATCGTVLSFIFLLSYLYNRGGIHGSSPSPGLWRTLGPLSAGVSVLSFLLAIVSRCRGIALLVGWLLGIFGANYAIFQLAID